MKPARAAISVITIFKNQQADISDTLDSLLVQTYQDFECILVDGNSTDRSVSLVQKKVADKPNFRLIRQASEGISNAFNEGVMAASSDYLLFLNGGDCLASPHSLALAHRKLREHPGRIISFRTEYMDESGRPLGRYIPAELPELSALDWHCSLAHQSTFVPAKVFRQSGGYLPVLKIAMDYELWLRARSLGYQLAGSGEVIARHRIGGVSFRQTNQGRKELILARLIHLGVFRMSLLKDLIQAGLIFSGMVRTLLCRILRRIRFA